MLHIGGVWKAAIAGGALLIGYWWVSEKFWQPMKWPTDQERFIYDIALDFKEPKLCKKIDPYAEGRDMWGGMTPAPAGYQLTYLQSDCYLFLAAALHDDSLCKEVRPLRRGLKDGSQITPDYCRGFPESETLGTYPYNALTMMQRVGYDERALREYQYRNSYANPILTAYEGFRTEKEFAKRVRRARTFDEPAESVKRRPPNDLEYLYEMFGVDTNDSSFCGKISPNAIVDALIDVPTSREYPLRFSCYRDIAFNKMDTRVCENLPTHTHLHSEEAELYLAENCKEEVQGERLAAQLVPNRLTMGPEFPPTAASFQRALHELGYDPGLPEPTDGDYNDFLLFLTFHADPSERAEFIQRVNAMP